MASKEDSGCDICLESNITAYCEDCNGYLCNSCFEKHALSRLFRGHNAKIVSDESAKDRNIQSHVKGSEMKGDKPGKCGKHVTENEMFYCDKHDKVICGRCVHADHRLCDGHIADLIEQSSNVDAGQTLSMLKELQENVNSKAIKNDENERNNKDTTENCLEDVEKFRHQINARIDFLQGQIEEKAKNKSDANKVLIIEKSSVFEEARQWLISKNEEIQNLSSKKQSLALCVALKRIEREMPEIRGKVEVADNRDMAMTFAFKGNVKLLTLLNETINNFGEIIDDINGSDELVDNVPTLVKRENTKTKKKTKQVSSDNIKKDQSYGIYTTASGLNVLVYNQSILSMGVECIASASNEMLVHGGGVAYAIAKAAGPHYVQACNEIIKANGKLKVGTAVATTAGKLRFACIIQAIGPRWCEYDKSSSEGVHRCSEDLLTTVYNVLKVANERQMASVALPAISSAVFGVPVQLCAMEYARAVKRFSKDFPGANLREVHFVDISAQSVKVIQEAFHRMITDDKDNINDRLMFIT